MMPSKSVTAVMGLGRTPCGCEVKGCEACGKGLRLSAANRKRGLRNEHFTGNETAAPVLTAVWEAFCRLKGLKAGELPERWNLTHPEEICGIHRMYLQAGSDLITTNTFGANRLKYGEELEKL